MAIIKSILKIVYLVTVQTKKGAKMYATELQTVITEPYVHIPEYESLKGKSVRVLFIVENDKEYVKDKDEFDFVEYYANNPVKLDKEINFLSRDESNER